MSVVIMAINLASIYALIAIGISLIWGGLGILNLAHGATFASAGYGAWWVASHIAETGWVVLLAGLITGAVIGTAACLLVYLPLVGRPNWQLRTLIATLAVYFIIVNSLQEIFGPEAKSLPPVFGSTHYEIAGATIMASEIGTVAVAIVVFVLLGIGMKRSRVGLGVRTLTQNPEGAALVGVNSTVVAAAVASVSGALVGLASVLLSEIYFVSPHSGFVPLITGLIVTMLGGLGSIPGTLIAAGMVGTVEALTSRFLGGQYVLMTLFLLIAVVLLVRPRGVAGVLEAHRA